MKNIVYEIFKLWWNFLNISIFKSFWGNGSRLIDLNVRWLCVKCMCKMCKYCCNRDCGCCCKDVIIFCNFLFLVKVVG